MAERAVRVGDHFIGVVCRDDPTTEAVLMLKVPDADAPGTLDCHPIDVGAAQDLLVLLQEALGAASPTRPVEFTNRTAFDESVVLTFPDNTMLRVPWPPGHDLDPDDVEWSDGKSGKGWVRAIVPPESPNAQD